jgi:hypothetical protein
MWSCAAITLVYLRNRTYSRAVGLSGGVPITPLTSKAPDASKFRVFGCAVFAKVLDKIREELDEKAFRGVMAGYPHDAHGYHVYNPATRRVTTSVHGVFQEAPPGFGARSPIDSVITDASDTGDAYDHSPQSHPLILDTRDVEDTPRMPEAARATRLRSHPIHYGEVVANLSDYSPVLVTTCCDLEHGKAKEGIFEQRNVAMLV